MRYLSISEVFELHDRIISSSGGSRGIRDISALESAVNQPRQTFDQKDLYPDIVSKAAALCFSLVMITYSAAQISDTIFNVVNQNNYGQSEAGLSRDKGL